MFKGEYIHDMGTSWRPFTLRYVFIQSLRNVSEFGGATVGCSVGMSGPNKIAPGR